MNNLEAITKVTEQRKQVFTSFEEKFKEIEKQNEPKYRGLLGVTYLKEDESGNKIDSEEITITIYNLKFKIVCTLLPLVNSLAFRTYIRVKDLTTIPDTYIFKEIKELSFKISSLKDVNSPEIELFGQKFDKSIEDIPEKYLKKLEAKLEIYLETFLLT